MSAKPTQAEIDRTRELAARGMTQAQAAAILGVTTPTVRRRGEAHGFEFRSAYASTYESYEGYRAAGMTVEQIAEAHGITVRAVRSYLQDHPELRPPEPVNSPKVVVAKITVQAKPPKPKRAGFSASADAIARALAKHGGKRAMTAAPARRAVFAGMGGRNAVSASGALPAASGGVAG